GADGGATAIARILQVDRVVIGSARSTVTGVSPFAIRAAAFDSETRKRAESSEIAATRDPPTTDQRLVGLAEILFRRTNGAGRVSSAAIGSRRHRFTAAGRRLPGPATQRPNAAR